MNVVALTITVLGGLALFVYGMGLMSEGLTQVAGSRLKRALGFMTRDRCAAILAGGGITALIQSSSATTVMTVGFVNAGLLSLEQAIGVVFGANVGTTITGQLVSFKLSNLALKVSRKTERLPDAFVGAAISAQVSGVVSRVRKFAHETIDVAREAGQPDGDEKRMTEEAIRAAIREAESMIWSDPQIRNAHPASALALLSIFNCLRDIMRHLGNIAVRVAVLPAK